MAIARWIVAFVAVFGFGGVLADYVVPATAKMHMKNPHWPPHAKFHNGQTMLMGVFAGTLSLVCLFAPHPLTLPWFFAGAAAAALYWVSLALAQIFPGTAWHDPEFDAEISIPLGLNPQQLLGYVLCALLVIAIGLAVWSRGSLALRSASLKEIHLVTGDVA